MLCISFLVWVKILLQGVQAVPAAKLTRKNKYNEMDNRNLSETLPYGKLAMLGIDKEKADLLPQEVKEKLLSGEVTPSCRSPSAHRTATPSRWPLKLQLVTDRQGKPGPDGLSRQGNS